MHQLGPADPASTPSLRAQARPGARACRVVASPAPYRGRAARPYRNLRLPCRGAPAQYCRHSAARPYALCSVRPASSPARLIARIATYRRMQTVVSWTCARRVVGAGCSLCRKTPQQPAPCPSNGCSHDTMLVS